MLRNREIISFSGRCSLKCKHCFAHEIETEDICDSDVEIDKIVESLRGKTFDVIYVSHNKENFNDPMLGVELCKKLFEEYNCDICITTRKSFNGAAFKNLKKLNELMKENSKFLYVCVSIPAIQSWEIMEQKDKMQSPYERIGFLERLKNAGIFSLLTIRPLFPENVIPRSEIRQIVDLCADKVDCILTGGLAVTDNILSRLALNEADLKYTDGELSEYLVGVKSKVKYVDVTSEISALKAYCRENDISFFEHSLDAINHLRKTYLKMAESEKTANS